MRLRTDGIEDHGYLDVMVNGIALMKRKAALAWVEDLIARGSAAKAHGLVRTALQVRDRLNTKSVLKRAAD